MQRTKCLESSALRFYARRSGHALSKRKRDLIREVLPSLLIDPNVSDIFSPSQLFKPDTEIWMEIGFGAGEHLAYQALKNPEIGFIGCEPYVNGVASLLDHIDKKCLSNIRIYNDDVRKLIKKSEPMQLNQVFLFFSDPWPKKRHHSRRFVNNENLSALSSAMKPGAKLKFSSDNNDFVRWSLYQFYKHQDFDWLDEEHKDWSMSFDSSIVTRYESKAIKGGRSCVYFTFQKHKQS